jgi:lipoprotein-anchoring transpeptidase ErfK/SrfK
MVIIVYSIGVFSSDFVASITPSYIPIEEISDKEKQHRSASAEKEIHDAPLIKQSLPPKSVSLVETVVETVEEEKQPKKVEETVHKKSSNNTGVIQTSVNTSKIETENVQQAVSKIETKPKEGTKEEAKPAKPTANLVVSHLVQANETLYSITMKYYLSSSHQTKVAEFNNLTNPATDIKAGMTLELPDPMIIAFHEVKQGETLFSITRNYYQNANDQDALASYNGIKDPTTDIKTGIVLKIPNQAVLKNHQPKGTYRIIINKSTNKLIVSIDNETIKTFPIATGKEASLTPEGTFTIANKVEKPWFNPENIPGGDAKNPLGTHWLGLDVPGTKGYTYGIHGTNDPSSIGAYASKGCIRMHNSDIQWLYDHIPVKTTVEIIR